MKKVKITVLDATLNEELAKQYGVKNLGPCPFHKKGDVFEADYAKPEGFCDEAWKAIHHYVFALSHDSGTFFYNDWIDKPGITINCCNDGLRPAIFKMERTDVVSEIHK